MGWKYTRNGKRMKKLKIISWNINGRAGFGNYIIPVKPIMDTIIKQIPDVIVLTEFISVACGFQDLKYSLSELGYRVDISPYQVNTNGILIAYKKEYISNIINVKSLREPNFLYTQITVNEKELVIAGVRITTSNDWSDRKSQFEQVVKELKIVYSNNVDFILAGDFNNGNIQFESNLNHEYTNQRKKYNYQMIWKIIEHTEKWALITPDQGGQYVGGKFSIVTRSNDDMKLYHTKDDHIISTFSKDEFYIVDYSFDFVTKENGYGELKPTDYLSHLHTLPDHAVLIAEINFSKRIK